MNNKQEIIQRFLWKIQEAQDLLEPTISDNTAFNQVLIDLTTFKIKSEELLMGPDVENLQPKINHADMVKQLAKPGDDIIATMTPMKAHLVHMAIGISGEAGELLDAVKKHVMYNKEIDVENVIEELGDLEFYMEGLRQGLNLIRQQTLDANIAKLGKRYKGHQYSDQQAQDRADKQMPDLESSHA